MDDLAYTEQFLERLHRVCRNVDFSALGKRDSRLRSGPYSSRDASIQQFLPSTANICFDETLTSEVMCESPESPKTPEYDDDVGGQPPSPGQTPDTTSVSNTLEGLKQQLEKEQKRHSDRKTQVKSLEAKLQFAKEQAIADQKQIKCLERKLDETKYQTEKRRDSEGRAYDKVLDDKDYYKDKCRRLTSENRRLSKENHNLANMRFSDRRDYYQDKIEDQRKQIEKLRREVDSPCRKCADRDTSKGKKEDDNKNLDNTANFFQEEYDGVDLDEVLSMPKKSTL